ncbi:MarR family winged helix-turn-helix transcriptional regulator [Kutzneria sp. NPDC052558]|uniref:MarR family winged helix-turn-helix transcriptional regulator n=1 Tax=Kutzneria sp. NPDC052558 TaxID=3364121 RepID=UPI0037C9B704
MSEPDVEELAAAADALYAAMRRGRTAAVGEGALTLAQADLLDPLLDQESLPVSQLARLAGVSHPTATRMIKQLETRDLVLRRRGTEDERLVLVALTETGREQLRAARRRLREMQSRTLGQLSPADRRRIAADIRRLTKLVRGESL